EGMAVLADEAPQRRERCGDVEQVVDRLAEQDEVPAPLAGVEVLREAGERLQVRGRGDRELVGRRVEHRRLGPEGVADGGRDDACRAADVEDGRRRGRSWTG